MNDVTVLGGGGRCIFDFSTKTFVILKTHVDGGGRGSKLCGVIYGQPLNECKMLTRIVQKSPPGGRVHKGAAQWA